MLLSVAYSVVKVLTIYFTTPLEIINAKKPPFSLKGWFFWSCWADSNRRPHPYQGKIFSFSNLFRWFIVISAPSALLSGTFETQDFRLFRLRLWLFVWSKAFGHLKSGSTHKDIRTKGTPVTYPSVTTIELLFPLLFYPQQF